MSIVQELRNKLKYNGPICGFIKNTADVTFLNRLETTGVVVHEDFQEGGRGYNWRTFVYRVDSPDTSAYFEVKRSVPAIDPDEVDDDEEFEIQEVVPKVVTVTQYEPMT